MQFNFLGKDSVTYENTVEVELPVYNAISKFQKGGKPVILILNFLYVSRLQRVSVSSLNFQINALVMIFLTCWIQVN